MQKDGGRTKQRDQRHVHVDIVAFRTRGELSRQPISDFTPLVHVRIDDANEK